MVNILVPPGQFSRCDCVRVVRLGQRVRLLLALPSPFSALVHDQAQLLQFSSRAQILILVAVGSSRFFFGSPHEDILRCFVTAAAVTPIHTSQFRSRAQEIVENVDDRGHVTTRPALLVLKSRV